MEFGIEKCAMLEVKSGKLHQADGMERPNQDKIRTLGENDRYKYLSILEVTPSRKSISGEPESYSKQNYVAGNLSKE